MANTQLQKSGTLSREQLLYLFDRFFLLISQPGTGCCYHGNSGRDIFGDGCCEELACDEAELGPEEFAEKMHGQQKLCEQKLEMLKHMRKFHLDDQSPILEKLHHQMEGANFESEASICHRSRFKRLFEGGCVLYSSKSIELAE